MKVFSLPQAIDTAQTYLGASQAGYEAINLASTAIRISWRSTDTAQDHGIELVMPAMSVIHAILFQGLNPPCQQVGNELLLGRSAVDFDTIADVPVIRDPYGRYKAIYAPYDAGYTGTDYDRIRFRLISSASVGAYFEIGSAYIFGQGLGADLIRNPSYGSGLEHIEPTIETELVNGARSVVTAGPEYDIVTLEFDALRSGGSVKEEPERIWRVAKFGDIAIDLQNENYQFWPMRLQENRARNNYASYNWDTVSMALREIVTV